MPETVTRNIGDCGYWKYLGTGSAPENPRVLTRAEKGQALTHLEMDVNLASLIHTAVTSSESSTFTPEEQETDVYFEAHKPTREEEMAGMFATFSYAPIKQGEGESEEILVQYDPIMVKVQHTTDEIRYKLSNEQIPGTLGIDEDFSVTGSAFVSQALEATSIKVNETAEIEDLRVNGTSSVSGDLYVEGNLYVNGVMFGNLSQPAYNSPNYAEKYVRWGVQDTSSVQSDRRLKKSLVPISSSLEKVCRLEGYEFNWSKEAERKGHDVGLVAQEVQRVLPEAVTEGSDGYLRVDYDRVVPLLVSAIKELSCQVKELQKQNSK